MFIYCDILPPTMKPHHPGAFFNSLQEQGPVVLMVKKNGHSHLPAARRWVRNLGDFGRSILAMTIAYFEELQFGCVQ